jgi:hypothetical protein
MQPPNPCAPLNPYAPPASDFSHGQNAGFHGYGVWQQDGCAVLYCTGCMLPNRCVVCNAPGKHRVHKTFFWHEPWLYVLLFTGVLLYAIVVTFFRKTAGVEYWLCDEHRVKRTRGLLIAWLGFAAGFFLMLIAVGVGSPELAILGVAAMIALPIVGSIMARTARPARITDSELWLKAGEPFVASLPATPQMGAGGYGVPYGFIGYGAPPRY